jgi:hypothetical protein
MELKCWKHDCSNEEKITKGKLTSVLMVSNDVIWD